MKPGTERITGLLALMGDPHHSYPSIHVAGSNGKTTTTRLAAGLLAAHGLKPGLFTSPHLQAVEERFEVGGAALTREELGAALDDVLPFAEAFEARTGDGITYFELTAALAFSWFATQSVDAAVVEVGLGGRLDAVNVFDADCAVVTSVDLDHMDYLGETREAIGFEKAGIFRPGRPAIVGEAQPPQSLLDHAASIAAGLQIMGRDFGYLAEQGQWTFWSRRGRRGGLAYPALRGAIQLANASTAIAGLEALAERLPVSMQDIRRGLIEVALPGRFQVLPGRPTVVLDVGHNPQAAGVLAENLGGMAFHPETWAVFGMLHDKDVAGVVERVRGRIDRWLVTGLPGPRGLGATGMAELLESLGIHVEGRFDSPAEAYRAARERAGEDDRIVAFGSFLTVSGVLQAIDDERKRRTT